MDFFSEITWCAIGEAPSAAAPGTKAYFLNTFIIEQSFVFQSLISFDQNEMQKLYNARGHGAKAP